MMKLLLTALCIAMHLSPGLGKVRALYLRAPESESACRELMELTKKETAAIYAGYHGVATMMMAGHSINPASKLSYFNDGKKILEEAIRKDNTNTELRFLRFCVQCEVPAFLNYRSAIEDDKGFILSRLPNEKDAELRKMMLSYMKNSEHLSKEEKEKLR